VAVQVFLRRGLIAAFDVRGPVDRRMIDVGGTEAYLFSVIVR
jgi:hypothetical protein